MEEFKNTKRDTKTIFAKEGDLEPVYSKNFVHRILLEDIYSTAVVILHCIEYIPPELRKNPMRTKKIMSILDTVKDYYSKPLYEILKKMLEPRPSDRMTLFEIRNRLKNIQSDSISMSF